jgi:hypothetical protein
MEENVYFLASAENSEPVLSSEHTQGEWFSYTETWNRLSFDDIRRILDRAESFLIQT